MLNILDVRDPQNRNNLHALSVSVARYGRGLSAFAKAKKQPEKLLELYEYEACPFCRKVRDALSELDLEYISHPCAKGAKTRETAIALGGKRQFPLLVDPNTGEVLYESEDIIAHLYRNYGGGKRPTWQVAVAPLDTASSILASALRPGHGRKARVTNRVQPAQMLVLYNFEASPYCRKVRERLAELDLHYHVRNVAKSGMRRPELRALGGKMQVPYLVNPNTGAALYESEDILKYLETTYG